MTPRLTGAELDAQIAQLHPSIRANFVYLPDTQAATHEEIRAAFPLTDDRIQRFYRAWHEAAKKQADAQTDAHDAAQAESEPA